MISCVLPGYRNGMPTLIQAEVALMRNGGALRDRIVAAQHQRARSSCPCRPGWRGERCRRERSTPGPFAVPDADHAIDFALADHFEDLAAHHGRRRQVLVHAGPKVDVVLGEQLPGARQRQIVAAQRRAFVAGNERAGVEPRPAVAAHLIDRQPDQRLDAGQIHAASFERDIYRRAS